MKIIFICSPGALFLIFFLAVRYSAHHPHHAAFTGWLVVFPWLYIYMVQVLLVFEFLPDDWNIINEVSEWWCAGLCGFFRVKSFWSCAPANEGFWYERTLFELSVLLCLAQHLQHSGGELDLLVFLVANESWMLCQNDLSEPHLFLVRSCSPDNFMILSTC